MSSRSGRLQQSWNRHMLRRTPDVELRADLRNTVAHRYATIYITPARSVASSVLHTTGLRWLSPSALIVSPLGSASDPCSSSSIPGSDGKASIAIGLPHPAPGWPGASPSSVPASLPNVRCSPISPGKVPRSQGAIDSVQFPSTPHWFGQ